MNKKVTDYLMIFIVIAVYFPLVMFILFNPNSEMALSVVDKFMLIASNVATFFFTKHQNDK